MAVIDNAYDNEPSKSKELAKHETRRQVGRKLRKKGKNTSKKAVKMVLKPVKWIFGIFTTFFGGILTPIICLTIITVLIVNLFGNLFDIEQYEQECPELVKMFLQDNFEEFEAKVKEYVNTEEFITFVCDSEFDNGYTKLVYGGKSAYTQGELKGNYNGVQGESATWVSYNKSKNKYLAKCVLETIEDYINQGVDVSKIKINDEYLKGYNEASGYGAKDTLPFTKWINNSYYVIPFYYHWNMARNSDYVNPVSLLGYTYKGTEGGLPNWLEDKYNDGYWGFMNYATTDGSSKFSDGLNGYPKVDRQVFAKQTNGKSFYEEKSYKQYLKTGWMSFSPNSDNCGNISVKSKLSTEWYNYDNNDGVKPYYAEGVMIGYKMSLIDTWLEGVWNKLWSKDEMYRYEPFSKYYAFGGDSKYDLGVDDLYVYKWFNKTHGNKSNYENYIMNPKNIKTLGQREKKNGYSKLNKNVEIWLDNFAEYFAKEIYYIYPNRQYIVDFFLNNDNTEEMKHKRIAFLQRSFYAMATGSELDLSLEEEYRVSNGTCGSVMTESSVGSINIGDLKISKVSLVSYADTLGISDVSQKKDVNDLIKQTVNYWNDYYKNKNIKDDEKPVSFTAHITYAAKIDVKYNDDTSNTSFKIPIDNEIEIDFDGNIISNKITFNPSGYDKLSKGKKWLKSIVKFSWDKAYYNTQITYDDEGRKKNKNPLDSVDTEKDYTLNGYQNKEWDIQFTDTSPTKLKYTLQQYCEAQEITPLFKLFDGKIKGGREINFKFSDHSFLNYDVNERKDENGNIKDVIIQIYTYYPDTSEYGDCEYRVAYGFENGDALQQAYNLLRYTQKNKYRAKTGEKLTDLNDNVDWTKLIIGLDDGSYADSGTIYGGDNLYQYIADILAAVESGKWWQVTKPYANSSSETTITVGAYQFFAERAHKLLKDICKSNEKEAKSILGDTLYKECIGNKDWKAIGYNPSDDECSRLSKLLNTDYGIQKQKEHMYESIKAYIKNAESLGVLDVKCQAYYCVMYHQRPASANAVVKSISGEITLDKMHQACLANGVFSSYPSRYNKTYEMCKNMVIMSGEDIPKELKKVLQYAQSKKVKGKKYSSARSDMDSLTRYKATYDCSELTYLSYYYGANIKISSGNMINTNCEKQMAWCKKNSSMVCEKTLKVAELVAGDLIFYKTGKKYFTDHVALYTGNGQVVDVKKGKGNVVKQRKLDIWDEDNFVAAYRVVQSSGSSSSINSTSELAKVPENQRLAYLFPNGAPTTSTEMSAYLTEISVPIYTNGKISSMNITVHKKLVNAYQKAFFEMSVAKFPINRAETAAYCWRYMASGTGSLSHHSYGSAIDVNSSSNPATYTGGTFAPGSNPFSVTTSVVNIWKNAGFFWGGEWEGYYKDYMHFTYTNH